MEQSLHEKTGLRGIVTITSYHFADSERAHELDMQLSAARNVSGEVYHKMLAELESLGAVRKVVLKNQVHLAAREMFAKMIAGESTYTGEVNYGALGTGSGVITDSDTQLGAEVARKPVASRTRTNDSVTIDFYYSKSDTDGTYNEFGLFIDGTATANTGLMYNRVLTGGWTKSSTEAMTVSIQLDFNAA